MPKLKASKIITLVLVVCFIFSPIFAVPARAQWVVFDMNLIIKEYILDTIAWVMINHVIERIAASTVDWINSGFEGGPAYVTDPESYFKNIADQLAGEYIFSNTNLDSLCGPISAKIRLALLKNYNYISEKEWQCTLTDVTGNMEDFMGDFSKGSWDKFFEMTQKPQNNPMGAFLQAETELNLLIASRQGARGSELDWGEGFTSWRPCMARDSETGKCIVESTELSTPGSVIENQLNDVLGSGGGKLEVADEINEMVSALLNQLVSGVVGGIGRGLRGMSGPSSSGSQSLVQSLSNVTQKDQISDYFGDSPNLTAPTAEETLPPRELVEVIIVGESSSPSVQPVSPPPAVGGPLSFSPTIISTDMVGSTFYPTISGGTPPYNIQVAPNATVATASLLSNTLTVSIVGTGQTSVIIGDSSSPILTAALPILIDPPIIATFDLIVEQYVGVGLKTPVNSVSVDAGSNVSIVVSNGTDPYTAYTLPDPAIATINKVLSDTFVINGIAPGQTSVLIGDSSLSIKGVSLPITVNP